MASPDLIDDAFAEILLRLPPDDPGHLVRATAVCKLLLRILSDPGFWRRYREFHRPPFLLGFFRNTYHAGYGSIPRFVPTTMAANPFPLPHDGNPWWVADCRSAASSSPSITASTPCGTQSPVTGRSCHIHQSSVTRSTTLLQCYAPWLAAITAIAGVAARAWSTPVSALTGSRSGGFQYKRGALVGDIYYCNIGLGDRIVKFELGSHTLSMIDPPHKYDDGSLLMAEEGSLGLAGISGSSLCLWSRMVNKEGIAEWTQQRVIELDQLLLPFGKSLYRVNVSAFAEGVRFIIMTCGGDVFMFDKKLWRMRKVMKEPEEYYSVIFPFVCFYKPDSAAANCHCQRRQL